MNIKMTWMLLGAASIAGFAQDARLPKVTAPPKADTISTAADSKGVSLTIYNQNFAVIREKRTINLNSGVNYLRYEDVAAQIDPTSLSFKSLTSPTGVVVREQNYQYDLLNPTSILNKSIGKTIRFRQRGPSGAVTVIEGTLLNPPSVVVANTDSNGGYGNSSSNYQGLVIRTNDGKLVLNPEGEMILDELPEGLAARPSLLWKLETDQGGAHDTEVSYIANSITWKADYVAVINKDDNKVDVTGWVTLDNKSGGTYKNASLQLMAGDVRRVQESRFDPSVSAPAPIMAGSKSAQFGEQSFFEYHLYTLEGQTTVRDNEQKQMALLNANDVDTLKRMIYDGSIARNFSEDASNGVNGGKVRVVMEVQNSESNHMGMPLPKGKVRIYKADSKGSLQFVGEDLIDHTPRDEKLRLYVGDSFDVVGERTPTNHNQINQHISEDDYTIRVKNHKATAVKVTIVEHAYGDWKIVKKSQDYVKKDAYKFEFTVTVPANGEASISYTIRSKY